MITLLFVHNADVLRHAHVCVCSLGTESAYTTDGDGALRLDLEEGIHWFKILLHGEWEYTVIKVQEHLDKLVVQVHPSATQRAAKDPKFKETCTPELKGFGARYHMGRVLGRGGGGVVYKARDSLLKRDVAIKVLRSDIARDSSANAAFLDEARGLANLSHPNLIALHDVITRSDEVLMITEFVQGQSLDVLLSGSEGLPQSMVLKLAIQLVRALTCLHRNAYVHRDIKPSNIMVQPDGTLKLIDFGLACSLEDITMSRVRVYGTPQYMAPEQLMGEALDVRCDLYQIGVTLYELLARKHPFASKNMAQNAHARCAKPLRLHAPEVNRKLCAIIHRCLEPDREQRHSSAHELLQDLQKLYLRLGLKGLNDVHPTSPHGVSTHRLPVAAYTLVLLIAIALSFVIGVLWAKTFLPSDEMLHTNTKSARTLEADAVKKATLLF